MKLNLGLKGVKRMRTIRKKRKDGNGFFFKQIRSSPIIQIGTVVDKPV